MPPFTGEKNRFKSRVNDQLNPHHSSRLAVRSSGHHSMLCLPHPHACLWAGGNRSQHYRGRPGSSSGSHTRTAAQRGRPWLPCPRGSLTQRQPGTPLLPPEPFS